MRFVFSILLILLNFVNIFAQKEIKFSRQGNKEYKLKNFDDAELLYRRSFDENPAYNDAMFNLGNALYKQEKYKDALKSFESLADSEIDLLSKADSYYNLGNSFLKDSKLKKSIEAYKNSLRLNPENLHAKYNLAYAQDQLKKQQQQQQQQQEQQNKDDQENKQKNDKNQQQQQGDDNKDKDQQDQQNNDKQQNQDKQEQKQQQDKMSKQDAERLLQALATDEQQVQEKVKEAKASQRRVRTLKNW